MSLGGVEDSILVVWESQSGKVLSTSVLSSPAFMARWLPALDRLEFATLSSTELVFWRLNEYHQLEFQQASLPFGFETMTCMDFTHYFDELNGHLLLVGTD